MKDHQDFDFDFGLYTVHVARRARKRSKTGGEHNKLQVASTQERCGLAAQG